MPVGSYFSQVEPEPGDAIWRFMELSKFRDLMASEELYFRRADLFDDKTEGIPPELWAMRRSACGSSKGMTASRLSPGTNSSRKQ